MKSHLLGRKRPIRHEAGLTPKGQCCSEKKGCLWLQVYSLSLCDHLKQRRCNSAYIYLIISHTFDFVRSPPPPHAKRAKISQIGTLIANSRSQLFPSGVSSRLTL